MTTRAVSTLPALSADSTRRLILNDRDESEQAELDKYGIERVPSEFFLWGGFRYSHARDALAAAKRNAK
jgi:hypothetical protein